MYSAPYASPYSYGYGGFTSFGFSPFSFFAPSIGFGLGGGSIFSFLLFGMLAVFLVQTVGSAISSRTDGGILGGGDAVSVMRVQVRGFPGQLCSRLRCQFDSLQCMMFVVKR